MEGGIRACKYACKRSGLSSGSGHGGHVLSTEAEGKRAGKTKQMDEANY